jgi:hypothetical protein
VPFVACAVVHSQPPAVYLAADVEVLHRVLALEVVARTEPSVLGNAHEAIREALIEERWGDAAVAWIGITGIGIDVYPNVSVYDHNDLPPEIIGAQLQFAPLFRSI